jgi:hypothetical protein
MIITKQFFLLQDSLEMVKNDLKFVSVHNIDGRHRRHTVAL